MPTRPQFTVGQLEEMVRTDPEKVVLHAFRTIEICLREIMKLGDAAISGIFDRAHREGLIGDLLYHQLRTLKRLRNEVIHDGHTAGLGDTMIALGTLHNFYKVFEKGDTFERMKPIEELPRSGHPVAGIPLANFRLSSLGTADGIGRRYDWREFQEVTRRFFEKEATCGLAEEVSIELPGGTHRFDLVSLDRTVVVECKSYTWTKSGKRPSAKWEAAQRACVLLTQAKTLRRILVFQDDVIDGKSLAKAFVRLNSRLIADIEVWRYIEGSFERVNRQLPTTHGSSEDAT